MDSSLDSQTFVVPQWRALRLRGDDALSFVQGQVTCDVTGEVGAGALLAPSSEVLTDFFWRRLDEGVELVLREEVAEAALARLRRFALRVAVTFELEPLAHGPYQRVDEQVARGLPGPAEFAAALSPRSFGDAFVARTVSFTKGCYTGQELVGRLDARNANVPFQVVRFRAAADVGIDVVLGRGPEGGPQGRTTTAMDAMGITGFAVTHRSLTPADALIEGVTLTPLDYLVDAS